MQNEKRNDDNAIRRLSPRLVAICAGILLIFAVLVSLVSGHAEIAAFFDTIVRTLTRQPVDEGLAMIFFNVRLPRIATALLAGAALGLSGAVFQGLLLNPLADPYTLGVSSGSAFGASLAITVGMLTPGLAFLAAPWATTFAAFLFACLTLGAVIALAQDRDGRLSPTSLILAGVILSAILSAAISFVKYLAGDQVASIVFWLLGSFLARTWTDALMVLVFLAPAFIVAISSAVDMNVMTMGERTAETLGVDTRRTRLVLLAAASLAAAAAVSVAGIIGFVGLIVPHLVRALTGPDHRTLLPLSALGGALLLLVADWAVRVLLPGEIPVGVLTALLAGPAFLVIFRKRMAKYAND